MDRRLELHLRRGHLDAEPVGLDLRDQPHRSVREDTWARPPVRPAGRPWASRSLRITTGSGAIVSVPLRPLHPHLVQEASGSTPGATVSPRWQHADANVSQHIQRPRIEALDGGLDAQQSRLPFAVAPTLSGNRRPAGRRSRSPPGGICGNSKDIKPRVDGSHGETDVTGSPAKRFRGMTSGASSAPSMSTNTFPHGASYCLTTCAQAGGQGVRELNRTLDGRANGHSPARRSSRNSEPGSTPVTSRRSRARVQAT